MIIDNNHIYYLESIYFDNNTVFFTQGEIPYDKKSLPESLSFFHNNCKIYIDWFATGKELNKERTLVNKNKFKNKIINLFEATKGSAKKTYYADGEVLILPKVSVCLLNKLSFLKNITRKDYKSQIFEKIIDTIENSYQINEDDLNFFVNKEVDIKDFDFANFIKGEKNMNNLKHMFVSESDQKRIAFGIKTNITEYYFKEYKNTKIIWTRDILTAKLFENKKEVQKFLESLKTNKQIYNSIIDNSIDGKIKIFRIKKEVIGFEELKTI